MSTGTFGTHRDKTRSGETGIENPRARQDLSVAQEGKWEIPRYGIIQLPTRSDCQLSRQRKNMALTSAKIITSPNLVLDPLFDLWRLRATGWRVRLAPHKAICKYFAASLN